MAQKIRICGAQTSLRGGELRVMLALPLEEGTYRLDTSRRIRVQHGHVVEVDCHLFEALDDLVDDLHEPAERSTAALGHETLIEARGSTKRRGSNDVLVRGNSKEQKKERNRENTCPFPRAREPDPRGR